MVSESTRPLTKGRRSAERRYRGIVNTFGAFQDFYATDLLSAHSTSTISWIGTFQGFLLLLIVIGTFLVVFGMMITSLSTEYYQLFLSQGLLVGMGSGALFTSSVAIVSTYFTTRRAVATGIVPSGGSIGTTTVLFGLLTCKLITCQ